MTPHQSARDGSVPGNREADAVGRVSGGMDVTRYTPMSILRAVSGVKVDSMYWQGESTRVTSERRVLSLSASQTPRIDT